MRERTVLAALALRVEIARILRFGVAGTANTIVGLGTVIFVQWRFDTRPALANAWGFATGLLLGYVLNNTFVFRGSLTHRGTLGRYFASVALAFVLNQIVLNLFVDLLPAGIGAFAAQGVAIATYTMALFLFCRFWIFSRTSVTHRIHGGGEVGD